MEAAFFDLDKTVIARASMVAFARSFQREGLVSRRTLLRALYAQLVYLRLGASATKLEAVREQVLRLTAGWDRARVETIVGEALGAVVEPILYAEALELLRAHHDAGRRVYLVSASPEEIVLPLARHIGADDAIASRAELDGDGRYTGRMAFYAYGPYKAEAMRELAAREGIDLAASYAYSDSYTDAPMLEVVGHPIAVNPDRVLAKLARDRGWEVRAFRRPVRVRLRVGPPSAGPATAAAAGSAAAIALAAGLAVRHRRALADGPRAPGPAAGRGRARPASTSWRRRHRGRRAGRAS